ncbi:MAG: winged helix-turn-helix transcriptional regulator, partial [Nitrososphaeraceae archaeon]
AVAELSVASNDLSETDLRIIKCLLLSGARIEISDIAKEVGISVYAYAYLPIRS